VPGSLEEFRAIVRPPQTAGLRATPAAPAAARLQVAGSAIGTSLTSFHRRGRT